MENNNYNYNSRRKKKRKNPAAKPIIISFAVLMAVGAAVALWLPLRPNYSEAEKRDLAKFPKLSFSALADGSYFSGISAWYSDTFPWREMFINANSKIKSYYGVGDRISGMSNDIQEEIPSAAEKPTKPQPTAEQQTSLPPAVDEGSDPVVQKLSSVLIVNDSGYEYYNFVKSIADRYAAAVSSTADALSGKARVFDIVVPTSMDIMLSDKVRKGINASNQNDAINYIYSAISDTAIKVPTYDILRQHRDEYIYFRTDHHWTALGAYYAYCQYARSAGIKVAELSDFNERQFPNFVGAFYNDTNKNPALEKNPDTVYAYEPKGNVTMKFTDKKGNVTDWPVIADVSKWNRGSKYNTFVGGDNPYSHIVNHGKSDGTSCVVIKESYGNAMIPFLTENYADVHIIDYRYWQGNIADFVTKNGIQDVIYLNNISATRNASLVNKISGIS